jgi:undecaprenyl diphosphate synthase
VRSSIQVLDKDEKKGAAFDPELLQQLDERALPKHVAIIMDGNGRWAQEQGLTRVKGHWEGANTVSTILEAASDLGVETMTLWAFSTENWSRSTIEVQTIMNILQSYLRKNQPRMLENGIRLYVIGDRSKLSNRLNRTIDEVSKATSQGTGMDLILAINYGARDELRRAIQRLSSDCVQGKVKPSEIDEAKISSYLDTSRWRDPDLVIRTSGETRISNFLLWQISYAELYFTETYWPAFTPNNLLEGILAYQQRNRRFGKE